MKRLRSGGLLSGGLLHYLRSGHVSRGQSRGRRPLFPMKWTLFSLFPFMIQKKLSKASMSSGANWASTKTKGIEEVGNSGTVGQRGLYREEKPSD